MEGAVSNMKNNEMIMSMNFLLTMDREEIPCKSIHGFHREREQEYIQEGGMNDYVHLRPKPVSKPSTLEIERYVTADYKDYFPEGAVLAADIVLEVGKGNSFTEGSSLRLIFKGCTVTGKSYGELNAEKGGIFTETVTVSYQELKVGVSSA